jgi:polysaccharide export outer membrane protein
MAMADEYFIRGEVKKVGNYPLIGDRTLLQAITAAGGYTDYAKLSKVTILRLDQDPKVYDCKKVAKRRISDPLIHPGDIIIVPRRILWK